MNGLYQGQLGIDEPGSHKHSESVMVNSGEGTGCLGAGGLCNVRNSRGAKDDFKLLSAEPGKKSCCSKGKKRKIHRKTVETDCHLHNYIKSYCRRVPVAACETANRMKKMLSKTKNKCGLKGICSGFIRKQDG